MSNACEICDYHNKQYACCERNGIGYVEENCQFYRWFEKGKAAAIDEGLQKIKELKLDEHCPIGCHCSIEQERCPYNECNDDVIIILEHLKEKKNDKSGNNVQG